MGDGFGGGDVDMSTYVWKLKRPVFGVYSLISFGYSISQLLSCLIVYYLQFGMLYGRLNMFKLIHNFIASQLTCLCVQFTVQDLCEHTFYTYDWLLSFCSWSNSDQDSLSSINTPLTHHICLKTICIQIDFASNEGDEKWDVLFGQNKISPFLPAPQPHKSHRRCEYLALDPFEWLPFLLQQNQSKNSPHLISM